MQVLVSRVQDQPLTPGGHGGASGQGSTAGQLLAPARSLSRQEHCYPESYLALGSLVLTRGETDSANGGENFSTLALIPQPSAPASRREEYCTPWSPQAN